MNLSRTCWICLLVSLGAIPAVAQKNIVIGPVGDTALLPYSVSFPLEADFGNNSRPISHTLQIANVRRSPKDSIIAIHVQNSPINVDEAASVFVSYMPSNHVITQDPLYLTIKDFRLFRDSANRRDGVALCGYRGDSAFVARNFPGTNHFDLLYLTSGVDHTGNGRWEPSPFHVASLDYDYDGTVELFFYLSCGRDKWPRALYCIDMDRLAIEWSLPMSSSIVSNGVVSCRDSVNPGVLVCTYGPDNQVSDENFDDKFGYFTRIDAHGKIVFNHRIAPMFAGPLILPVPDDSLYILFHPWPLPGQSIQNDSSVWVSLITADGLPIKSLALQESFVDMDLQNMDNDSLPELLTVGRSGRVRISNLDLELQASSDPSHLSSFVTTLTLPERTDPAMVFSSQDRLLLYSSNWKCLGAIPHGSGEIMPAAYDSSGSVVLAAFSWGNGFAFGRIAHRPLSERAVVILWRFRYWFVSALGLVSILLFIVNVRRRRAMEALARVEARNDALLSATPDLMFRISADGVFLDYQASRSSELFAPGEQFLGRPVSEILPPSLAQQVIDTVGQTLKGRKTQSFEYQLIVGGQLRDYEARLVASGKQEVLAIVRDITERKSVEVAIQRQAQILQQVNSMVVVMDTSGIITDFNRGAELITGYTSSEVVGSHISRLYPGEDWKTVGPSLLRSVRESGRWQGEVRTLTKQGVALFTQLTISSLKDAVGTTIGWIGYGLDIHDRKLAELALRDSEEKYRALAVHSSQGILLMVGERIIFANGRFAELMETTVENLVGMSVFELIRATALPEETNQWIDFAGRCIDQEDIPTSIEIDVRGFAGTRRRVEMFPAWFEISGQVIIQTTWLDISARYQAELALRSSEEKYRRLAEHANMGVVQYDDERVYYANEQIAELLETTSERIMAMSIPELASVMTGPDSVPKWLSQIRDRLQGKEAPARFESDVTTFKGNWKRLEALPTRIDSGHRPLIQATFLDISARYLAESALKESEEKFRAVADSMTAGITIFGENKLLYCNPASERITGYTMDELLNMNFWEVIHPSFRDLVIQRGRSRMAGEQVPNRYEVMILRKDGVERWVDYSAKMIDFLGRPAVLGTTIDITDAIKAKEELQRVYNEQYRQVREIAGGVSHEIYNSLFPATTTLHKLRERIATRSTDHDNNERDLSLINLAEQAIARAIHMTESVTQYSRLEANRNIEEVSVAETVQEIVEHNRARLDELQIKLEIAVPDSIYVGCSHPHFYSLINNLVVNAIDALSEVDGRTLLINAQTRQENIQIQVVDSGPGIPAENLSRIFTAFFSTKPRSGTGLGLAMVKKIAEMYSGSIKVSSNIDKGTCFDILIPRVNHEVGELNAGQPDQR